MWHRPSPGWPPYVWAPNPCRSFWPHAGTQRTCPVGHLSVDAQRQRCRAVHVLFDHRHPVVGEIARQLSLNPRVVDGMLAGRISGLRSPFLPEAVDHRCHQAQHAARALKLDQRRPVGVQPVKHLRMDRVGCLEARLVVGCRGTRAETPDAACGRAHRRRGPPYLGPRTALFRPAARTAAGARSQTPPRRSPVATMTRCARPRCAGGRAPLYRAAPDLSIVGLGVGRTGRIGGWQADDQQALARQLGRLGEGLGKGELGLKAACRQVAVVVQLAGIGHPFVDQDQARAVLVHQLAQRVARAGPRSSSALDAREGLLPPSCQASSPHRVRTTVPSGLVRDCPARSCCPRVPLACSRQLIPGLIQQAVDAEQLARRRCRRTGGKAPASSAFCHRRSWSAAAPRVAAQPFQARTAPTSIRFRLSVR
jgi:hypothetical protein